MAGTGKTLIARQIGKMLNGKEPKIVNGPEVCLLMDLLLQCHCEAWLFRIETALMPRRSWVLAPQAQPAQS